ncbi:MAG TPA: hypothetical protein VMD09_02030 [Solirubrobacteraceae bacterium]|nr:hypothetical protein [Solirubrobacteraceae bacterium]
MVLLVAGTGGAIAIGAGGSSGGPQGGAANAQYCPPKKKCPPPPPPPKHNCGRYHNQKCPTKPKTCYYKVHGHRHAYKCPAPAPKKKKHHKPPPKHHKSTKKSTGKNNGGGAKCTTRTVNGLTVLFCNSK